MGDRSLWAVIRLNPGSDGTSTNAHQPTQTNPSGGFQGYHSRPDTRQSWQTESWFKLLARPSSFS